MSTGACGGQKALGPWEIELQVVGNYTDPGN